MKALAQEHVVILESPDPKDVFVCSPGIERLAGGRLVVADGVRGPGIVKYPGPKTAKATASQWQGRAFTSDDGGKTWILRKSYGLAHARPFQAGGRLYIIGHDDDLAIMVSEDGGDTFSDPVFLTQGEAWHQAPCNVWYANGCVYLVMERRVSFNIKGWYIGEMAPVLMRGRLDADLTKRENWTFASELPFTDLKPEGDFFGVPYFDCPYPQGSWPAPGRNCAPMGWLETNVVRFTDPDHIWSDPEGKTFHLWMRAHTGGTGYAAIAKVVEQGSAPGTGPMTTMLETVPSGKKILFLPCPGGQMKFHILYDEKDKLYWLLSTQATDSMTRIDRMPADRYNLPNNERQRLVLHFSKNCVDWCFAGLVCDAGAHIASRHYASMVFDGEDLCIASRSGDERSKSAHDGNLVTFHRVKDFRSLVY